MKTTPFPCIGEEGCPQPSAQSGLLAEAGPGRLADKAESMCLQLTRAAQSPGCQVTAPCVSVDVSHVNMCASVSVSVSANAPVSSLELLYGPLLPWPSPGNSGAGSHRLEASYWSWGAKWTRRVEV